jgi:hypothetical protein
MGHAQPVQPSSGVRVVLSVLGGVFTIGVIEGLAAVYTLLRFGLAGSQSATTVYVTASLAALMCLAAVVAAVAVLTAAIARDASSLRRGWYLPMMFLALVIYFALLMASYFINSTTLYGEMLFEKQASVAVYLALAVLAAFIGVRQYRLTPV